MTILEALYVLMASAWTVIPTFVPVQIAEAEKTVVEELVEYPGYEYGAYL